MGKIVEHDRTESSKPKYTFRWNTLQELMSAIQILIPIAKAWLFRVDIVTVVSDNGELSWVC